MYDDSRSDPTVQYYACKVLGLQCIRAQLGIHQIRDGVRKTLLIEKICNCIEMDCLLASVPPAFHKTSACFRSS